MSDYLKNLIARNMETAVTIQPRPLSLYEPAPSTLRLPQLQETEGTVINEQPSRPETAASLPVPDTSPEPAVPLAPAFLPEARSLQQPPTRQVPPPSEMGITPPVPSFLFFPMAQRAAETPEPNPKVPVEPERPQATSPDKPAAQGETAVERTQTVEPVIREIHAERSVEKVMPRPPVPAEKAPPSVSGLTDRPRLQPAGLDTAVPKQPPSIANAPDTTANNRPQIIERTTVVNRLIAPDSAGVKQKASVDGSEQKRRPQKEEQRSISPVEPAAPIVTVPVLPRLRQDNSRKQSPETPSAPTIQVHIGRIEVRAAPPSAKKSPPKRRQPQAIGLDDYLRQRNGQGGQR